MPDKSLTDRIEKALDGIRPYLEADGGNVRILEVDSNNKVILELMGSCGNCPMSTMTLKAGVEESIKREVPEVTSVEAVNITSADDPNAVLPHRMM